MQDAAPAPLNVPARQLVQATILAAPTVAEAVPAMQLVQELAPAPEYLPAAQRPVQIVDEPVDDSYRPAGQAIPLIVWTFY